MGGPIDVLLIRLPRLLSDIISATLSPEPEIRIVSEPAGQDSALSIVRRTAPDVAIVGMSDPQLDSEWLGILFEHPRLRVFAVVGEGRDCFLWEMCPRQTPLGEISPRTLLEAVRATAGAT